MAIERYDHYGKPRFYVTEHGSFLVRDVFTQDNRFAGVCENGHYEESSGEVIWYICKEGEEFVNLRPFLPAGVVDIVQADYRQRWPEATPSESETETEPKG